jgi:hypothetical protein
VAHGRFVQALDQEDTGLLHFSDEGHFFAVLDGDREGQHDFVEVAFQGFLTGVQVQPDAWGPLLTEDGRAFRRFERQVTHIDALQRKLWALGFCCFGVLLVSHRRSFLILGLLGFRSQT